ncbi:hypothetical protein AURDEDRAFT_154346 [Auricularia subglabra TFB-10046 SS5]|uniref:Uncharacterized protein n=1 Tax=Auricularia subglabra (strain TFB-10046 / SS5) TaxID=717982 RepID=J0WVX3_AURST|nr:hypothetical protein AURDEDRAFT_154346 [Auricularia subglabra TFB-10046 SS5]
MHYTKLLEAKLGGHALWRPHERRGELGDCGYIMDGIFWKSSQSSTVTFQASLPLNIPPANVSISGRIASRDAGIAFLACSGAYHTLDVLSRPEARKLKRANHIIRGQPPGQSSGPLKRQLAIQWLWEQFDCAAATTFDALYLSAKPADTSTPGFIFHGGADEASPGRSTNPSIDMPLTSEALNQREFTCQSREGSSSPTSSIGEDAPNCMLQSGIRLSYLNSSLIFRLPQEYGVEPCPLNAFCEWEQERDENYPTAATATPCLRALQ